MPGFRLPLASALLPSAALWSRFDWNSSNFWIFYLFIFTSFFFIVFSYLPFVRWITFVPFVWAIHHAIFSLGQWGWRSILVLASFLPSAKRKGYCPDVRTQDSSECCSRTSACITSHTPRPCIASHDPAIHIASHTERNTLDEPHPNANANTEAR
jgi:hypothetical protein